MECAGKPKSKIQNIGNVLLDVNKPLKQRFRALFTLKNLGGHEAIDCIAKSFKDTSDLLKHECAFCLGQMQDVYAIPILLEVLKDKEQCAMVRHEAGEALGAIGSDSVLNDLDHYSSDEQIEVAETCQLAAERIRWHIKHKEQTCNENFPKNPYMSVDPTPPCRAEPIFTLKDTLLNENLDLFERYRAMFTLRNIGTTEAALALAEGLKCKSALFRHEIAYVLGQLQDESCVAQLKCNLEDEKENYMVRHECAEALGGIATQECMQILEKYIGDDERVVKESCEVALDMCDYFTGDDFQYADTLQKL